MCLKRATDPLTRGQLMKLEFYCTGSSSCGELPAHGLHCIRQGLKSEEKEQHEHTFSLNFFQAKLPLGVRTPDLSETGEDKLMSKSHRIFRAEGSATENHYQTHRDILSKADF